VSQEDGSASPQASGTEVESYREWRLSGQPLPEGAYPYYDLTFREREKVEALARIWEKVDSGEYAWRGAKFQSREVTIVRTAWQDEPVSAEGKERSDS